MYERSAIVLERYFEEKLGLDDKTSIKANYHNYKELVEELQELQAIIEEEEEVIASFDEVAKQIQEIQKEQEKLCATNKKLEEERVQLFNELDEESNVIEKKMRKIEETIEKNNERLKELRASFIDALAKFTEKQKERNKVTKIRREEEANNIKLVNKLKQIVEEANIENFKQAKIFISLEDTANIEEEINDIMLSNGKKEKIGFNSDVIESAVRQRTKIAKREIECYVLTFERLKKILAEVEADNLKLAKYEKALKYLSAKLAFLEAEKDYIVAFLDYERMTVINGKNQHDQMMKDACEKFDLDMEQIEKLYALIVKEIAGKGTKKAYKELYDETYLKEIEQKEKNFEKEINNINTNIATVINTNYWRIDGIKNIYEVFKQEITEKFEKDLIELGIIEPEEEVIEEEELPMVFDDDIGEEIQDDIQTEDIENELAENKIVDEDIEEDEDDISDFIDADFIDDDFEEDEIENDEEDEEDIEEYDDEDDYEDEEEYDDYGDEEDEEEEEYDDYDDYDDYDEEDIEEEEESYEIKEQKEIENEDEDEDEDEDDDYAIVNNYINSKKKSEEIEEDKGIFKKIFKSKKVK